MDPDDHPPWQDALAPLQLDAPEEEAYVLLLQRQGATATELAQTLRISRNQAYRIGATLVARRLARQTMERPVRFLPRDLDSVLHMAELDAALRLNRIHGVRRRLKDRPKPSSQPAPTLELISGRKLVYQAISRLIHTASERLEIMDTHPRAGQDLSHAGLLPLLRSRITQGIDVRSVLRGAPPSYPSPYRIVLDRPDHVRWVLRDRTEAVIFVETEDGRTFQKATDKAMRTTSTHVVGTINWLFDHIWEGAEHEPVLKTTATLEQSKL